MGSKLRVLIVFLAVATMLGFAAGAHADVVKTATFDDLPAGTRVLNQYAASSSIGVTWPDVVQRTPEHPDGQDADDPVVTSAPGLAHSGNQVADLDRFLCTGCEDYGDFAAVGTLQTTAKSVSVYVGDLDTSTGTLAMTLTARDSDGHTIGIPQTATVTAGAALTQKLEVDSTSANIASFIISSPYSGVPAIDDLSVSYPDVPAPPDFTVASGFGVLDVLQGQTLTDPIAINRLNGSNGNVAMSVSGLPTGMTGSFSPNPVPGTANSTTLSVTAAQLAPATPSSYSTLTITGTPASAAVGPAPRTTSPIARVSENCKHQVTFDYVDLRDTGCLTQSGAAYQAIDSEVHVDGLVLTPRDEDPAGPGGHVLTVDPVSMTIKSAGVSTYSVTLLGHPDIPIYYGPISWSFKTDYQGPVPLDQNSTGKPKTVEGLDLTGNPKLAGIPMVGVTAVFTTKNKAVVTPVFKLDFFPLNEFGAITASGSFTTDNDNGTSFSGLEIKVPDAKFPGVELKNVDVKYVDSGTFSGSVTVIPSFTGGLGIGGGYGIKNGNFDFLTAQVSGINTLIGSGIYLQSIGFEVHTNPTKLVGSVGLSAGPSVAGKTALSIDGSITAILGDPWSVEVDGDAKLGGKYQLASAFVRYSSYGVLDFGGKVHLTLDPVYLDGSVQGWVAGASNFDVEGAVHGCIDIWGPDPCAGAKVLVSSIGVAGCVEALGYGVGAGYTWGGDLDAFTGCDLSPWRPVEPTGARAAAALEHFNVSKGLPAVAWQIKGVGGVAPDVTVTGPGHRTVTLNHARPYVHNAQFTAYEATDGNTYVTAVKPAAGSWTIADAGSIAITSVKQAFGLPKPAVTASVSGKGYNRVLRYHVKKIAGQVVLFVEIGKNSRHVITKTTKASGTVPFTVGDGTAGTRTIEAIVEQDRHPRSTLTVAHFKAPGMLKPTKVAGLVITRKSTKLTVTWNKTTGSFAHAVYLTTSDKRGLLVFTKPGVRTTSFSSIPTTVGATATVTGLTKANGKGPAVKLSIKASAKTTAKAKAKPKKKATSKKKTSTKKKG